MRASACALLAAALLAGCGGGEAADTERADTGETTATEQTDTAPQQPDTAPESPQPTEVPEGAVALVGDEEIGRRGAGAA